MSLFSEFSTISKEEWLSKIEKDLKGKALEDLNWKISEDWMVSPIAHSSDLAVRETTILHQEKTDNNWEIGEVIFVKDAKTANQEAIDGTLHYRNREQTIEELTQILLSTNAYLKEIEANQVNSLQLSIAIGESYFINIAKIRALKILWHNLMSAYELETPLTLEAHLATSSLTDDQHQNMIQMSTQALSAVIAGVDRLFLTPADHSYTAFTKRIARNVQHLLQLESHLDQVIDPSAGSYYIEKLTNEIVEQVWGKFTALASH